jgi:hypothetical protein
MYVMVTTFGQFILLYNVVCLHSADFIGVLQIPFVETIPRMLTFSIAFGLWFGYLPIPLLTTHFLDLNPRRNRKSVNRAREKATNAATLGVAVGSALLLMSVHAALIARTGFASPAVLGFGVTLGAIAGVLVVVQYVPQIVTTCKLGEVGSLSIALMAVQAPGGTANPLFMAIAQEDSWTTWISILGASVQMWILLIICIVFKLRSRRAAADRALALESTLTIDLLRNMERDVIPGGFDGLEALDGNAA